MKTALDIILESRVWDNQGCMPLRPHDTRFLPQLARCRAAGLDHISLNVGFGDDGIEQHLPMIASFRHGLAERASCCTLVRTVDDIESARNSAKLAASFDIEGANAVADQISLVQLYCDLGVRWMLLAYNRNNRVGGGCQDEDTGLTPFGREVIAEMERVGMQVCCSHTGHRTVRDAATPRAASAVARARL